MRNGDDPVTWSDLEREIRHVYKTMDDRKEATEKAVALAAAQVHRAADQKIIVMGIILTIITAVLRWVR